MYTILVNNDNTLMASIKERIMHRSTMVDKLHFLVDQKYGDLDMSKFTCILEYKLPISNKYIVETLVLSQELYKNKLEYLLPITTKITSEFGNVSMKLTFTYLEMDENGNTIEHVRNTDSIILPIIPIERWSDYIPDTDLDAIAQIMMSLQSKIEEEKAYAEILHQNQVNDLVLTNNLLQVSTNGTPIGTGVKITSEEEIAKGFPTVVIGENSNEYEETKEQEGFKAVEF